MTHLTEAEAEKVGADVPREGGVDEMLQGIVPFINQRPGLISLLYDVNMLPEQVNTRDEVYALLGICEIWRRGEQGQESPYTKVEV